jgi:hypothetical protein
MAIAVDLAGDQCILGLTRRHMQARLYDGVSDQRR